MHASGEGRLTLLVRSFLSFCVGVNKKAFFSEGNFHSFHFKSKQIAPTSNPVTAQAYSGDGSLCQVTWCSSDQYCAETPRNIFVSRSSIDTTEIPGSSGCTDVHTFNVTALHLEGACPAPSDLGSVLL